MANQLRIAEKCSRAMMIGVEESQGLLLEDEEQGVNEFEVFREVVQLRILGTLVFTLCVTGLT